MKSRTLTRILALITGLLLIGIVIFGFSFFKQQLTSSVHTADPAAIDTSEAPVGMIKGPFCLRLTYPKIGNQAYVSFNIYYLHDGSEELWYSCGRMFSAADTASID